MNNNRVLGQLRGISGNASYVLFLPFFCDAHALVSTGLFSANGNRYAAIFASDKGIRPGQLPLVCAPDTRRHEPRAARVRVSDVRASDRAIRQEPEGCLRTARRQCTPDRGLARAHSRERVGAHKAPGGTIQGKLRAAHPRSCRARISCGAPTPRRLLNGQTRRCGGEGNLSPSCGFAPKFHPRQASKIRDLLGRQFPAPAPFKIRRLRHPKSVASPSKIRDVAALGTTGQVRRLLNISGQGYTYLSTT